jgi:hypothetical protein
MGYRAIRPSWIIAKPAENAFASVFRADRRILSSRRCHILGAENPEFCSVLLVISLMFFGEFPSTINGRANHEKYGLPWVQRQIQVLSCPKP